MKIFMIDFPVSSNFSEIQRDYETLKRSLSEEFNKKMSVWGQKKSSKEGRYHQSVTHESQLSADFKKKLDEWQRIKHRTESHEIPNDDALVQIHVDRSQELEFPMFDFRKKIDPWHKPKDKGPKSSEKPSTPGKIRARPAEQKTLVEEDLKPEFKLKVAEWELRKAMTGHSNKTTEEISKLMPEDFNKKLREWEQLKVSKPQER